MSLFNTLLSIPYYRHIILQRFPLFSIIVPIFFMERVLGYNQSRRPWHSFACSVCPEDGQLLFIHSCWCCIDLVMMFFFVSPWSSDPHENFNSYSLGWLFDYSSLFLHNIFFKLGLIWSASVNWNLVISFFIFVPIFGIQGKVVKLIPIKIIMAQIARYE